MRKTLLLGLSLSALLLSGCGQNVDTIKAEFAKKANTNAEQDFEGYTVVLSKSVRDEMKAFEQDNKLPSRLNISDEQVLEALPDVNFEPDTYDKAVAVYEQAKARLAEVKQEADVKIAEEIAQRQEKIAQHKATNAQLQASIAEYYSLTDEAQTAYDEAKAKVDEIAVKMDDRKEQFHAQFKSLVLAHELPIDANKRVRPSRYYNNISERSCKKSDPSKIKYLTSGGRCVYVSLDGEQSVLEPAFRDYGVDYLNLQAERKVAKETLNTASRALSQAQTIAKNKTNVNVRRVESTIKRNERAITGIQSSIEYDLSTAYAYPRAVREDQELRDIYREYNDAVTAYHREIKKAAVSNADLEVASFDDEQVLPELNEDDRGMVLYVFTDDAGNQKVYLAPVDSRKNTKTFGDLFRGDVRTRNFDFEVASESDAVKVMESFI